MPGDGFHPGQGLAIGRDRGVVIAAAGEEVAEVLVRQRQATTGILIGRVGGDGGAAVLPELDEGLLRPRPLPIIGASLAEITQGEGELAQMGGVVGIDGAELPGVPQHLAIHRQGLRHPPLHPGAIGDAALDEPEVADDQRHGSRR